MSAVSEIQWTDSTVNPIMGCHGCELFPKPGEVTKAIDVAVKATGATINSHDMIKALVGTHYALIENPGIGFKNVVTTTNIYQLREEFTAEVLRGHGPVAAAAAMKAIRLAITCYAAKQHCNKGLCLAKPSRKAKKGYAPTFEQMTRFPGRVKDMAKQKDLLGQSNPRTPWKKDMARLIFVSDMGDALCTKKDFEFLEDDVMAAINSADGKQHLWQWLTKRPENMAKFGDTIGGFPPNVCVMTTVTSLANLDRVDQLRKVKASCRGLSIEPLWERIPPENLNLEDIDWVIVGGESGSGEDTRPFDLAWAEELRDLCKAKGVAFFMKQIGRNPVMNGKPYKLPAKRHVVPSGRFTDAVTDPHGGDMSEWPEDLRVREFPKHFHDYRADEKPSLKIPAGTLRPVAGMTAAAMKAEIEAEKPPTKKDEAEFKKQDEIVRKGVDSFVECGQALQVINERKLWRAGGHSTWEGYCREVAGMSKSHAYHIVAASKFTEELSKSVTIENAVAVVKPRAESQVRPLLRLEDTDKRVQAWGAAVTKAGGGQPTAVEVTEAVFEILGPDTKPKKEGPSSKRAKLIAKLRLIASKQESWDAVTNLCLELEALG